MKKYTNIDLANEIEKGSKSFALLAREYNISRPTVRAYAKRLNLHKGNTKKLKIHTLDVDYFKKIDTQNKAYVLGFIYADGCNTRYGLDIGIKEDDLDVMEFIKNELKASNKLRYIKPHKKTWSAKWQLGIKSIDLSKDLTNVGCPPAKSLILKFPSFINDDLMPHFIRGYFDGDGHINFSKGSYRMGFTSGSISFITDLQNFIYAKTGVNIQYYTNKYNNCKSLQTSNQKSIRKVLTYLYNNSSFSMKRKREKAQAFLEGRGGM
jgi:hypothetical protein